MGGFERAAEIKYFFRFKYFFEHVHEQIKQRGDTKEQKYVLLHNNRNELLNVAKIKFGFIIF